MDQYKGYFLIIVSMLIWGSVGIFGRLTGQPSTVIVFYRVASAFVTLALLWVLNGCSGLKEIRKNWKLALASGVALGLNWYFFFAAINKTTVANAVLSYYASPIIVTILSPLLLKERLEKRTIMALSLGFLGIVVMMAGPGNQLGQGDWLGIGLGLLAAFFYALLTIMGKIIKLSARLLVLVQTGVSSLIFLPYVVGRPIPSGDSLLFLLIIGIVHTALALTLYFEGIKWVKVQHVGILSYLDPLSAIVFALLFLGEIPGIFSVFGGILILLSSYLVVRRRKG